MKKPSEPLSRELPFQADAPALEPPDDEAAEIRYSLTALGEAVVSDRRGRFRGFGPCIAVA